MVNPALRKEAISLKMIQFLSKNLNIDVNIDGLTDKWKLYQMDEIRDDRHMEKLNDIMTFKRVDDYWPLTGK